MIQAEQNQVGALLQALHAFVVAQSTQQMAAPQSQFPAPASPPPAMPWDSHKRRHRATRRNPCSATARKHKRHAWEFHELRLRASDDNGSGIRNRRRPDQQYLPWLRRAARLLAESSPPQQRAAAWEPTIAHAQEKSCGTARRGVRSFLSAPAVRTATRPVAASRSALDPPVSREEGSCCEAHQRPSAIGRNSARSAETSGSMCRSASILALIVAGTMNATAAYARLTPHADPSLATWFQSLTQPGTGISCGSISDCRETDFRITDNHYEALIEGRWLEVPSDKVLPRTDNPTGRAVVCWTREHGIMCFVRGPET
jgi:hypothetical protein